MTAEQCSEEQCKICKKADLFGITMNPERCDKLCLRCQYCDEYGASITLCDKYCSDENNDYSSENCASKCKQLAEDCLYCYC